ncbi:XRE family transcriptional regulator [Pseudomonas shirazensis]|uniref:Uncharacterized protein n=2 Tax=Pseudomonas TaxID=286 RepID=A0A2S3W6Z5_PSEPU|nr:XRE family transcriptional regulator [Pseudomonas putida]POF86695.1 hypothetical protein BGP80_01530 [Pseudomonas putida]
MIKATDVAGFYEVKPAVDESLAVHKNAFIELMGATRESVVNAYDTLAYLAGIKSAPLEDQYKALDTSSLQSLMLSAEQAGFTVRVIDL